MSTLSKPASPKSLEARIVNQTYLYRGKSVLLPHYNATTACSKFPLKYGGSTGGASAEKRQPISVVQMAPSDVNDIDNRISRISSSIRVIPDFPKPGILFQDITTLLLDPKAFKDTIDLFVERYKDKNINVVADMYAEIRLWIVS
ncbi:adenine phosphoribosyltransferase 3 [Phtheirospermum japonicum]|uniref:adenine phosphoribosyltransferase n=1 Tax=Phtheirospermum japonicum TaxID=374723 RepID=A0A830C3S8_9LAMI|nr:adenine phosphoribosyltransferase 3 [Phtheirospermum japonicum]